MTIKVDKKDQNSYKELINTSMEEIVTKLQSKEIEINKDEHKEFVSFARMNEADRTAFVNSISPQSEPPEVVDPDTSGDIPPVVSDELPPVVSDADTPPVTPVSDPMSDTVDFLGTIDSLRRNVANLREKDGKLGQSNKTLKEDLAAAQEKIKEFEGTALAADEVQMPEMPTPPDQESFTEGFYDPEYKVAMDRHRDDLKTWQTDLSSFVKNVKPDWVKDMAKNIEEVGNKAEQAFNYTNDSKQEQADNQFDQSFNDMWSDVKQMQEATSLKTTLPIETINTNQNIINEVAAAGKKGAASPHTDAEIAAATAYLNGVPKAEMENYNKIVSIVSNLYAFDEAGTPYKRHNDIPVDLAWTAAIRSSGVQGIQIIVPTPPSQSELQDRLSQQQQQQNAAPSQMPAASLGASENLNQQYTIVEKQKQLLEMTRQQRDNSKLLRDTQFQEKFKILRAEVTAARK